MNPGALATLGLPAVALLVALGLAVRARGATTLEQWSVGNRGFGSLLVFMLLAGELYTTFTLLGASGWAYARGAPAYYVIGYAPVAYVLSYWLLPAIWRRGTTWRVLTQPEYYAHAFRSPVFGTFVAVVGLSAMLPYLVLQLTGLGIVVAEASSGQVPHALAIGIGTLAMTAYVILAGIRGSAYTAMLKDVVVLAAVVGLGLALPHTVHGGVGPMFDTLLAQRPDFFTFPARGMSGVWYASTLVMTVCGFYLWPHTFASVFSARDAGVFRRNAALLPLYQLILLFVFFVGFAAITAVPGLHGASADLALLRATRATYGPWVLGFVGAAGLLTALVPGSLLLMAMATILARLTGGSRAITSASTPAPDATSDSARDPAPLQAAEVRRARWLVPVVACAALVLASRGDQTLATLLLLAYAVVTQLFPSLLVSLLWPAHADAVAAMVGIVVGEAIVAWSALTGASLAERFPQLPPVLADINIGGYALMANALVFLLVRVVRARTPMGARGRP